MNFSWLESIVYGFFAGMSDILPVSAEAHRILLITLFGEGTDSPLLRLLVHISILGALYFCCQNHILRISRAYKLLRVPKRRRKRPLDIQALMDLGMLKTMLIPLIFGFIFYQKLHGLVSTLNYLAATMLLNGIILFVPQFLPGSNKDSQSMSPLDSLLMGIAAAISLIPGISCIGLVTSVALVRGADKKFALNIALLLNMIMMMGLIVVDFLAIFTGGVGAASFVAVLKYLLAAASAFGGTCLAVTLMRKIVSATTTGIFAFYCWGAALLSFILFLTI